MSGPVGPAPAIVWSIAGTDSGGGAGLAADQRAADAMGVHLGQVVAAVTAQNSQRVTRVQPLDTGLIAAQMHALHRDMRPRAIKTGLLGGAAQIRLVATWVDRLRQEGPLALVVDPVLAASTGAGFVDANALAALRDELLPRANVITPNRHEALRLLGADLSCSTAHPTGPALAQALRARMSPQGASPRATAVCITGGDSPTGADPAGWALDWLDSEHAQGWLALPRLATPHHHGTGCTFATSLACALALGFPAADAAILAKMVTTHALRHARAAGQGPGPVVAQAGFAAQPDDLPLMSWGESALFSRPLSANHPPLGLYALVDGVPQLRAALQAGVRTLQLRIKTTGAPSDLTDKALRLAVADSLQACRAAGAQLFINDHWRLALEWGANGVHLGQEDLLALSADDHAELAASGVALGISTHSLWELCRARTLAPRYIACGPVWPTLTKAMPWRPQGLDNLRWWQRMAGCPVVAIGGILSAQHAQQAAQCGVDGVCVVRALGPDPTQTVPALLQAVQHGPPSPLVEDVVLPHPCLEHTGM